MQLSDTQAKLGGVLIAIVVIGLGYWLWSRSATPEPTVPPGQSLRNPLGAGPLRGAGGGPGAAAPGPALPAPGTVDRQLGFGPSKGAPIPGAR